MTWVRLEEGFDTLLDAQVPRLPCGMVYSLITWLRFDDLVT